MPQDRDADALLLDTLDKMPGKVKAYELQSKCVPWHIDGIVVLKIDI